MCYSMVVVLAALVLSGVPAFPVNDCSMVAIMNVSAYDNTTGDPRYFGVTASGVMASENTVAAGLGIPFGTVVWIPDIGLRIVQDRGGEITDSHLDVWMPSYEEALVWGRRLIPVWFMGEEKDQEEEKEREKEKKTDEKRRQKEYERILESQ